MTDRSQMPSPPIPDSLLAVAADWVARIQAPDASESDFSEWEDWLKSDPAHAAAYSSVEEIWELVPLIDPPWPTREELAADTVSGGRAPPRKSRTILRRRRAMYMFGAAAALAAVVVGFFNLGRSDSTTLETTTAEQRSIALPDGSRVTLAPETRVILERQSERRGVRLERGQAYFEVAHDPSRPFVVRIGSHEAVAVGTAFDINENAGQFTVTVTQGIVQVQPVDDAGIKASAQAPSLSKLQLQVGDRAEIDPFGVGAIERMSRPEDVTAWRSGRLEYVHQRLRVVLQDVNRYTDRKIELSDPSLGELYFTGTVFADQLDGWLAALPGAFPVEVVERGSRRILRRPG